MQVYRDTGENGNYYMMRNLMSRISGGYPMHRVLLQCEAPSALHGPLFIYMACRLALACSLCSLLQGACFSCSKSLFLSNVGACRFGSQQGETVRALAARST